jgi:hypothetical protein
MDPRGASSHEVVLAAQEESGLLGDIGGDEFGDDGAEGALEELECTCDEGGGSAFGTRGMVAMVSCPKTMNT